MLGKNPHKIKQMEEKERLQEERTQQKLEVVYRKQPYSVRWRVVVPVSNIFSWVFQAYAFLIESFAIAFSIYVHYQSTISMIVGAVLGPILGAGIELVKRVSNENFFHAGIAEDDWNKGNGVGMGLTLLASIGLAFMGGLNLPEATTTPPITVAPILENVDAISADYDKQIATQEQSIKDFDKAAPRWKGMMNRENSKQLGTMKDALSKLMESKNIAIQDAKHRNRQKEMDAADAHKTEMLVYTEYKANTGLLFALIALVIELLIPLPFWAKQKYYFYCALERGMGNTVNTIQSVSIQNASNTPQTPINQPFNPIITTPNDPTQAPPTSSPTTPITRVVIGGFGVGLQELQENKVLETEKAAEKKASNVVYTEFHPNLEYPPKEPVQEQQKETIILKNTYTHQKNTGGGSVEMGLPLVQSRVRQYQARVDEAVKNIEFYSKKGDDINVKMWHNMHHDRVKNLVYWQQAEQQLSKQIQKIKETVGE